MQHHHTHTVWSSCLKTHILIHRPNTRSSSCLWYNTITYTTSCHLVWKKAYVETPVISTPSHVQRLVILFERPYVDPPYQHSLFLMCVMQHHHTHTVWSSCLKTHTFIHRPNTRSSSCLWYNTITRIPSYTSHLDTWHTFATSYHPSPLPYLVTFNYLNL